MATEPRPVATYVDVVHAFQTVAEALTLSETRELDPLLRLIADQVCSLLNADRCSIHLRDVNAGLYRGQAANSSLGMDDRVKRLVLGMPADGFTREIVETKRPVVLVNAMSDPRAVRSAMQEWNTNSVMGVPMILGEEVIGLVIVDDAGRRCEYSPEAQELTMAFAGLAASAIAQAQLNTKLRSTLETVARQNRMLRRANALEDELSALLIDGSSLQGTVDLVARTTGRPCAIYTAELRSVATAHVQGEPSRMIVRLFDSPAKPLLEALAEINHKPSEIVGPFAALGLHNRYLVAPIRRRDAVWGYLVIGEHATRFGALDGAIARRAARNVAVELSVQQRAVGDRWEAYESFAAALIKGTHSEEWITTRAEYLQVAADGRRIVCAIAPAGEGAPIPTAAELSELLGTVDGRPRAIGTSIDGMTILLLDVTAGSPKGTQSITAARELEAALQRLGRAAGVVAAVSRPSSSLRGIRAGYEEVLQVAESARRHVAPAGGVLLTSQDLGVGRLFLSTVSPEQARRFVSETLGELAEMKTKKTREVMSTLAGFLTTRSVGQTAKQLEIHENTVRYRLARVEAETDLDVLLDPDDQMTAHVAVLILRIGGADLGGGPVGRRLEPAVTLSALTGADSPG
ncbi:MAG: putative CdaR family transcriptional regulator [Solirubrobacterales bacterium]|nr:putative CdaR family transcriptional regulator [Solirubrobacterales bacterium]